MSNVLDKIQGVTVDIETAVLPEDQAFCEDHQTAYDAVSSYYLSAIKGFCKAKEIQMKTLERYYPDRFGNESQIFISTYGDLQLGDIAMALHKCHLAFIHVILGFFNEKYHLSYSLEQSELENKFFACLHGVYSVAHLNNDSPPLQKFLEVHIKWQDIYMHISDEMNCLNLVDASIALMKSNCRKLKNYEIVGNSLRLNNGCSSEFLNDVGINVIRAIFYMENQNIIFGSGFLSLCKRRIDYLDRLDFGLNSIEFVRTYKNNRLDIKFSSKEAIYRFAREFLGRELEA